MAAEVTVAIYDPKGRSPDWWEGYLSSVINAADADIIDTESEAC